MSADPHRYDFVFPHDPQRAPVARNPNRVNWTRGMHLLELKPSMGRILKSNAIGLVGLTPSAWGKRAIEPPEPSAGEGLHSSLPSPEESKGRVLPQASSSSASSARASSLSWDFANSSPSARRPLFPRAGGRQARSAGAPGASQAWQGHLSRMRSCPQL